MALCTVWCHRCSTSNQSQSTSPLSSSHSPRSAQHITSLHITSFHFNTMRSCSMSRCHRVPISSASLAGMCVHACISVSGHPGYCLLRTHSRYLCVCVSLEYVGGMLVKGEVEGGVQACVRTLIATAALNHLMCAHDTIARMGPLACLSVSASFLIA